MANGESILVVEDDGDVLESIREILEEAGYRVAVATNGLDALGLLRDVAPAAMLVDFVMPVMDGGELLKACALDPKLAQIPALIISGKHPEEFEPSGSRCVLRKPFGSEQLLEALRRVLS